MNLANKLTMVRVILIPFFLMALYLIDEPVNLLVGVVIFAVASITDFVDGYIARSRNLVTDFGKFMDPLADKLLVASALVYMTEAHLIAGWITVVILSREFIVSGIRLVAATNGQVVAASIWGKIKTFTTMVMIIVVLLNLPIPFFDIIEQLLIYASACFTVLSGWDYVYKNRKLFEGQM